jgi:hypothetical protein
MKTDFSNFFCAAMSQKLHIFWLVETISKYIWKNYHVGKIGNMSSSFYLLFVWFFFVMGWVLLYVITFFSELITVNPEKRKDLQSLNLLFLFVHHVMVSLWT